jgi:hypothetical protein
MVYRLSCSSRDGRRHRLEFPPRWLVTFAAVLVLGGDVGAFGPLYFELAATGAQRIRRRADGAGDFSRLSALGLHPINAGNDFRRENPKRHLAHERTPGFDFCREKLRDD